MRYEGSENERFRALVSSMITQSESGEPVSRWQLATFSKSQDWRDSYRTVGQFMATDVFTVRPDDIVDFAASLMEWRYGRHIPGEDDTGRILGRVSHRQLLRLISRGLCSDAEVTVRDIMHDELVTVTADTTTVEAIRLMRDQRRGGLPVVDGDKLVGLVTDYDLIVVSSRLLESYLSDEKSH